MSSSYDLIFNAVDNTGTAFRTIGTNLSSLKDTAVGLSTTFTSIFSAYQTYEGIERAGVMLERANLTVKRAAEGVDQAQKNYNEAVAKYGVNSSEAKDAADKLSIAQDALAVATDRAEVSQNALNDSYMRLAITIVPTAITAFSGLSRAITGIQGLMGNATTSATDLSTAFTGIGAGATGAGGVAAGLETGGFGLGVGPGGGALVGGGMVGLAGAVTATAAVALTPLLADFAGKQAEAIEKNPTLKGLMTIRGGGAMPTGTDPFAQKNLLTAIQTTNETSKTVSNVISGITNPEHIAGVAGHFQHGGIIRQPTLAMMGEAGPEAIVPLTGGGGATPEVNVYIQSPLVYVAGAADRNTASIAAQTVRDSLKNVMVEATSTSAGATHKQIRVQNSVSTSASFSRELSRFRVEGRI